MRQFVSILTITVALTLAGCSGSQDESSSGTDQAAGSAAETVAETAEKAADTAATMSAAEPVAIAGTLGCGHCTHHIGTHCTAAVQTADGAVYIIDGAKSGHELYDQRFDGKDVKVTGAVSEVDGAKHLALATYEID
jgi:hypothetical protein